MKKRLFIKIWFAILTLGLITFIPTSHGVFCLPTDPAVVSGTATFSNPDPNTLQINASNQAIINYGSFSIGQGESVIIRLPSMDNSILNRVLGDASSQLLGNLNCNGLFILVNQNGIFIGPNANIDVGSLILSTRNITDSNFLSSGYVFEKLSKEQLDMLLLNQGKINVRDGGFGVLIAGAIENQGTIIAKVGTIALAGGDKVTLNMAGNSLISVAVDAPTAATIVDKDGKPVTDQIKNSGRIEADGGLVVLKADSLPGIFINAINLEGYVRANKVYEREGKITILTERDVVMDATLEATRIEIGKADEAVPENVQLAGALTAEESVTVLAKNDIQTAADITAQSGDVRLFADYDGNGRGEFRQQAGIIEAKGQGDVYIDGSGTMTLGEIRTEEGAIKIGTQRTPDAIAGEPKYVHSEGDIQITAKERVNDVVTLETDRRDVLRYNPEGKLTLEATKGLIQDLTLTPLAADYLRLIANGFMVNSVALTTELYKNNSDPVFIRGSTLTDGDKIHLEGDGIDVTYLKDSALTLRSDNAVRTSPGVIIQATQVKVIANQFGTQEVPLNVQANHTYFTRLNGSIDIMESLGLGSSIMLRGPPDLSADGLVADGFGAIIYSADTNLFLDAQTINLLGTNPTYLYGNITFNNFSCTIPGKEIYFEAGKTYTFQGNTRIEGSIKNIPIYLYSGQAGAPYYVNFEQSITLTLRYVNLRDAYNLGAPITLVPGKNQGNCAGWIFDPLWTGLAGSQIWSDAGNWWGGDVPEDGEPVTFDATATGLVSLMDIAGLNLLSLTIDGYTGTITLQADLDAGAYSQNNGTFNTNDKSLNVSSFDLTTGGIFNAGASTITCSGNWSIGTTVFNRGTSTVIFNKNVGTQTLDCGAIGGAAPNFYKVTHSGTGILQLINNQMYLASDFLNSAGTFDANNQNMAFAENWTNSGIATFTRGGGTLAFTGTTTLTNSSSNAGDLAAVLITGTVTLGSNATMASVSGAGTLNLGTGGYTLTLSGTGTPLAVTTFNKGSGGSTVNYTGSVGNTNVAAVAYHNLSFTPTLAATYYLLGNLTGANALSGSLTIGANATLDVLVLPTVYNIALAGDWVTNGAFTCRTGTVTFNGTAAKQNFNPGTSAFNIVVISNTHADGVQLNTNPLITSSGVGISPLSTFDIQDLAISGGGLDIQGTLRLIGNQAVTFVAVTTWLGSTVDYYGSGNYTTLAVGATYYNLKISGGGTYDLTAPPVVMITVNGDLTISSGTLDLNGTSLNMNPAGTSNFYNDGTLRLQGNEVFTRFDNDTNSGTIVFDGSLAYAGPWTSTSKAGAILTGLTTGQNYNKLTFNGSGSWTANDTLDINSNFTITQGTFITNFDLDVGGNWTNAGTFTSGNSRVTFDGIVAQAIDTGGIGAGQDFYDLTISNTAAAVTVTGNNMKVTHNLTLDAGTAFTLGANRQVWVDGGTLTLTGTPVYAAASCIIDHNLAAYNYYGGTTGINKDVLLSDFVNTDNVSIKAGVFPQNEAAAALSLTINNNLLVPASYVISSGALDVGGAITINGTLSDLSAAGVNISLEGNWDNTNGVFNPGLGTVIFDGGTGVIQLLNAGGIDENHNFMNLAHNGAGTLRLTNALYIDGDFSNLAGTFDANANAVTFTANEVGHTIRGGNSAGFYDVTFNGIGGGWTLTANLDVNRDLFITNGALSAGANNINIARDLTIAAGTGTFTPNTSTVIFDDAGYVSHILGTTFYNLTCITPNKQLEFQPLPVIETIQNNLTLNGGASSTPIILNSTDHATRFTFDVTAGTQTVYYVNVSNSQASSNDIRAYYSVNNFNTDSAEPSPHWIFVTEIPPEPPFLQEITNVSYEEGERLKKRYPKGKYRTTVIVFEGKVVVAPYDEYGVKYDEAVVLTGGQRVAVEGKVE